MNREPWLTSATAIPCVALEVSGSFADPELKRACVEFVEWCTATGTFPFRTGHSGPAGFLKFFRAGPEAERALAWWRERGVRFEVSS